MDILRVFGIFPLKPGRQRRRDVPSLMLEVQRGDLVFGLVVFGAWEPGLNRCWRKVVFCERLTPSLNELIDRAADCFVWDADLIEREL